jgi:branched-chain amino acid transport system substrate-binding protein
MMVAARRALAVLAAVLALTAAPAGAADPGVTDAEIVLGGSASLSGPLAYSGEQTTKFGVDLYFKIVNEGGGIHGRKVRTVYYDDGYRAHAAAANTKKLVEGDRVFAVIAPPGTLPMLATLAYVESHKVPLLVPFPGLPVMRGRAYVFNGMALYDRQSRMMIDRLAGSRKLKKFAALYQDDEYGRAFLAAFGKDLARYRLKLATAEPVKDGAPDVSAPVARLRAARPEIVFLVLTPRPAAQALKERQRIGWTDATMVSAGPLTDEGYLSLAGDAAEGVEGLSLWPDPLTSERPGVRAYRDAMKKHFASNQPNPHSLAGYFAAMLFTEGARRAGRALSRDGLVTALESVRGWDSGILPPLTVGADHEAQKQGLWVRIEKGRFTQASDWLTSE